MEFFRPLAGCKLRHGNAWHGSASILRYCPLAGVGCDLTRRLVLVDFKVVIVPLRGVGCDGKGEVHCDEEVVIVPSRGVGCDTNLYISTVKYKKLLSPHGV